MTGAQAALGTLLAAALGWTFWGYSRRYGAGSARQRFFRTVGVAVLDLLLILLLLFTTIDFGAGISPKLEALRKALFLTACVMLLVALLFIAVLDALESFVLVRREQRALAAQIVQAEIARAQEKAAAAAQKTSAAQNVPPDASPPFQGDDAS